MRGTWTWITAAVLLAAAGALAWWKLGPVDVEVVHPTRGPAIDAVYATGSVEPTVMMPIAPRAAGHVVSIDVDEGSVVRKGQQLARLDDSDLASTVDELEARARFAREQFDRNRDLVSRGFLSPIELERSRADLDAAEAALRRARTQRGFMSLTAPADGVVIRRDGEIGQFIPVGQAVFVLSCCAPLRVSADVDEEDIPRVRVGQPVVLHADALPGRTFDGTVTEITPKGDPVARTFRVRIRLAEPSAFRVGMTVDANLIVARHEGALLVPTAALQAGQAWIVRDGRLQRRRVHTGIAGSERSEVLDGLSDDDPVVAAPTETLREGRGARARVLPAPAAKDAPASAG